MKADTRENRSFLAGKMWFSFFQKPKKASCKRLGFWDPLEMRHFAH
jgi:hypothetical protein